MNNNYNNSNPNRIRVIRKEGSGQKPNPEHKPTGQKIVRHFNNKPNSKNPKPYSQTGDLLKANKPIFKKPQPRKSFPKGRMGPRPQNRNFESVIPPLAPGDLRIIPLAGVEWIGTNMTAVEYMDEIIIIDAGFGFGNPDTPGIDYTIPDVTYLEERREKIKGILITHGHLDHVGAIPFIIEKLGYPTFYTREFGSLFIQKRMEEFPGLKKLNIVTVDKEDGFLPIADSKYFKAKFFGLTHSIPDSTGIVLKTPLGNIVTTGDVRVENHDGVPTAQEHKNYEMFKNDNVLLLMMDSTGVNQPGWSLSEDIVKRNIDEIIKNASGRLFIATFSSQVERIISFMESAKKHHKYVAIEGRSMKNNLAIVEHLKLTEFDHVIPIKDIESYPPNKIVVLLTGAQGEEYAALNRIANETHKDLKLNESDTIVLSASVVPGNEYSVGKLKDNLFRNSHNIITYEDNQVHASGHGKKDELTWIHKQIPYTYFIPIHGLHHMLKTHATLAKTLGCPQENIIVPDNGSIIEIRDEGSTIIKLHEKAPAKMVVVDGEMIGPIPEVVMRDRKHLGEHGIFVVVVSVNPKTGKLKKSPDLISRGFVYLRDNQELLQKCRLLIKRAVERNISGGGLIQFEELKNLVTETVERFLIQETGKEPIVIPVVLGL